MFNQIETILRRWSDFQFRTKIHLGQLESSVHQSRLINNPIETRKPAMLSWLSLRKLKVEPPEFLPTACQIVTNPYSLLIKNNWRQVLRARFRQCARIKP